jgi:predicted ATPase
MTIEDLHWADPSTLEMIQLLVEQVATARLLLLCTARPEFRPQWPLRARHTQITLNRLRSRNVRKMIGQVAAHTALSQKTIALLVERTGGVPLFVEELTRAVLESNDRRITGREIPVTLHDSLMSRLDRLGAAKEVVQIGAVIGSEFSYELLHAVHPIAEEDLQRALRNLADAEILYVRGIAPDARYFFKHGLIRDAAYEALLKSRRKDLHRLVAHTITEKFPALKEAHPEVAARHWTEAGETEQAIAQWSVAAKAAEARNAFLEAQESYQQSLALSNLLPESPQRDLRELQLRQSLVSMLNMTRGWAAPETVDAAE